MECGDYMIDLENKILRDDVQNILYQDVEEFLLMAKYCLKAYVKSVICFGVQHPVTKDVVEIWKEFVSILIEEKNILKYLIQYSSLEDLEEVNAFMFELDDLNTETIQYYYQVLDGIESACEMKTDWRAVRPKKDFDTLIETDEYRKKLCSLTLSMEDIKSFLDYKQEFWKYIETRLIFIDSHFEEDKDFYGVNIKLDDYRCLMDMKVMVPTIINLETALVNVHEFHYAYQLFEILGSPITKSNQEFEESAKKCECCFQEEFMAKKYQKVLTKKYL